MVLVSCRLSAACVPQSPCLLAPGRITRVGRFGLRLPGKCHRMRYESLGKVKTSASSLTKTRHIALHALHTIFSRCTKDEGEIELTLTSNTFSGDQDRIIRETCAVLFLTCTVSSSKHRNGCYSFGQPTCCFHRDPCKPFETNVLNISALGARL